MLLRERAGTPWDGQWMGAFAWRRTDGPWSGLPGGPMLDEHWTGLLPNYVLTGFPSTAFGGLVDAGVAVGWLHHAAALHEAQLSRQGLAHRLDLRPDVGRGGGEPACAPSYEGARRELSRVDARKDFQTHRNKNQARRNKNQIRRNKNQIGLSGKTQTFQMDTTDGGGTSASSPAPALKKSRSPCPRRWKVDRENSGLIRRADRV